MSSLKLGGSGRTERGRGSIEIPNVKRKAPPSPASLKKPAEKAIWRKIWSQPVSALWETDYEEELVLDLVLLRARLRSEGADAPLGVIGQIRSLEDRLHLSPRARRVAGIVLIAPEPAATKGPAKKPAAANSRRRKQLIEGQL